MRERVLALKANISSLMLLLDEIRTNGVESAVVHIANDDERTYNVGGIYDALSSLLAEVTSATAMMLPALEEQFEHDRLDVYRIVGRLAQIAAERVGSANL